MKAIVNKKDAMNAFRNLDLLESELSQQSFVASQRAAGAYVNLVKTGIGGTTAPPFVNKPWEPLSEAWKKAKKAHKEEFWIETGAIFRNVKIHIIHKFRLYHEVFAGLMQADDPEAFERALKNEFGLGLGPARPLFQPAIEFLTYKRGGTRRLKRNSQLWLNYKMAVTKAIKRVYKR